MAAKAIKQKTQEMQGKRDRNTKELGNLNSLLLVYAQSSRQVRYKRFISCN